MGDCPCDSPQSFASSPSLATHRSDLHTPTTPTHNDGLSSLDDRAPQLHSVSSSVDLSAMNASGPAQLRSPTPSPLSFLSSPPTSRVSAAMLEPPVESAPTRAFRNRTAAQLKPYSIENAKYTRTLLKNGWQGAVVAGLRGVEESESQMRRRKELGVNLPRDNLQGWLEYEAGQRVAYNDESGEERESDSGEDSLGGDDILEREARKQQKMTLDSGRMGIAVAKGKGRMQQTSEGMRDHIPLSYPY